MESQMDRETSEASEQLTLEGSPAAPLPASFDVGKVDAVQPAGDVVRPEAHEEVKDKGASPQSGDIDVESACSETELSKISDDFAHEIPNQENIDTKAPFESVRQAVSKFGGITDWKERRKNVKMALQSTQQEIDEVKGLSETAIAERDQVLMELQAARSHVEELKHQIEKSETEESQAKQDLELAELRLGEVKDGIANRESMAVKAELVVAKERHSSAVAELASLREEIEALRKDYASLVEERDAAAKKAEEASAASGEVERSAEELNVDLMELRELLQTSHAAHIEAEEQRAAAAQEFEQEKLAWESELHRAQKEAGELSEQSSLVKDLETKLDAAVTSLQSLRAELLAYTEGAMSQESADVGAAEGKRDGALAREALTASKKELEEVKASIEKATDEVSCLGVAAASLKTDLEHEKEALEAARQREESATASISALEVELLKVSEEFKLVRSREMESREKTGEMPAELQQASAEAEAAKAAARSAQEELNKAREGAAEAMAARDALSATLEAVIKEIEASRESEKLAAETIKALQENEERAAAAAAAPLSPSEVMIPEEQYEALSKKAAEAEELANQRILVAMSEVEEAKESELRTLQQLEELSKMLEERRAALNAALEKEEEAKVAKLAVEQELREWRAEHEQQRKSVSGGARGLAELSSLDGAAGAVGPNPHVLSPRGYMPKEDVFAAPSSAVGAAPAQAVAQKKGKKSFFPRVAMFLARKKHEPLK